MRSFNSLTVLCTIAFSFTSAAPLSSRQSSAVSGVVNEVNGLLGEVPGTSAVEKLLGDFGLRQLPNIADPEAIITEVTGLVSDLGVRSTPASVAVVFTQVFTTLTPYVEKLQFINAQNATVADITPVVAQIKTTLTGAVTQIQQLKGQPASVILAGVNGATSISVADLAKILAADLCILFTAVGAVLKVVSTDAHAAVASLLVEVATVIGTLLQAVCAVVTGLAAAVLPLLTTSVQTVIKDLGVSVLVAVLGITA